MVGQPGLQGKTTQVQCPQAILREEVETVSDHKYKQHVLEVLVLNKMRSAIQVPVSRQFRDSMSIHEYVDFIHNVMSRKGKDGRDTKTVLCRP